MAGSEPIFQSRHKDARFSSSDQQPFSVLNGVQQSITPSNLEIPIVATEITLSNNNRAQSFNRTVEFEGDTYWWHQNKIRVHVQGSGWTSGPTTNGSQGLVTSQNDTQYEGKILGFYPFLGSDGQQKLAALYIDSSFSRRLAVAIKNSKYTGDGAWSSETVIQLNNEALNNSSDAGGVNGYPVQDGNKIYIQFHIGSTSLFNEYVEIDLDTKTAIQFTKTPQVELPGNVGSTSGNNVNAVPPSVFCGHSGIIWHLYRVGGATQNLGSARPQNQRQSIVVERVRQIIPQLDLVVISGMTPDGNISQPAQTLPDDYLQGRSEMWANPASGRMYALTFINGSGANDAAGWACWRLRYDNLADTLVNEGDIGWKVLPPPLRLSTSSTIGIRGRFKAYNIVDVSGQLTTIFEYMNDGAQGSLVNTYKWIDEDTEMRFLNVGGDASNSRPLIKIGGGEFVWSERQPYDITCRVDASGADAGKLKIRSRVLGEGEAIKVRYYFTSKKEPMRLIASISAPTSGSILSNELTGVTANSGEFVVDWDIQNQGFNLNDEFNIHPIAEDA